MQAALQIIATVEDMQRKGTALQAWRDCVALAAQQVQQSEVALQHRRVSKIAAVFSTWAMCAFTLQFTSACI
jgi:hypothetical protein